MTPNVLDWRRFASPNKGLRSKTRAGKMWVQGGVGASEATDLADRNPGAAERRRSANRLLCDVKPAFYNLFIFYWSIGKLFIFKNVSLSQYPR